MRRFARATSTLVAAAALSALPAPTEAQIAWDSPTLVGPDSPGGFGVLWLRSSVVEADVDAAMATWALPGTGGSVILRGGVGIDRDGDPDGGDLVSAFGGLDLRATIARHSAEQPLDLAWHAGLGVGAGPEGEQYVLVTLPMGVSAGRSWASGSIWLAPYVSMGLALDLRIGEDAPDEEFEATPAADIGFDLALDPSRHFILRVATSLGDRQALVLGLNVGGAR